MGGRGARGANSFRLEKTHFRMEVILMTELPPIKVCQYTPKVANCYDFNKTKISL